MRLSAGVERARCGANNTIGMIASVCVFCGSSPGARRIYLDTATRLGAALAHESITVIYGGTDIGLMGAVANGARGAGGAVVGVITEELDRVGIGHAGLARLEVVADMHARKARMAELADGFVALPGGFGTWEELFEVLTWAQLGLHTKPIVALDVDGFFAPLRALVDHAVEEGFVRSAHRDRLRIASDVTEALVTLRETPRSYVSKWSK